MEKQDYPPQSKNSPDAHVRAVDLSPFAHNLPVHLPLFHLKPLDHDNHGVAHHEVGVLVLVGVAAHADGTVGQVAEHAAAVLAGDGGIPAAAHGVALFRAVKGLDWVAFTEIWRSSLSGSKPVTMQSNSSPGWYSSRRSGMAVYRSSRWVRLMSWP